MITARFYRDSKGNIERFRITGHADSGPYGSDIVCAAVSATAIGTTNSLNNLAGVEPDVSSNDQEGGLLDVKVPQDVNQEKILISQVLLENLQGTLFSIAANYSNYIEIQNDPSKV